MTTAVCVRCGAVKFGSYKPCPRCNFTPSSEHDKIMSFAISDHFLSRDALDRASADIASGGTGAEIDKDTYNKLRDALREESKPKGLFSRMFKSSDNPIPPPAPEIVWRINLAFVRNTTVILKGDRRSVEMEEGIFCLYLNGAKKQGWLGGDHFFFVRDGKGANIQLVDGMSIVGEEAKALGQALLRFLATQSEEAKQATVAVGLAALCQEGGFEIVTKETAYKTELERLVPDWKSLDTDQIFHKYYLMNQDKKTGRSYQELLQEAHSSYKATDAAWFFDDYKKRTAQAGQTQQSVFLSELERLVPDWASLNSDPGFLNYLTQRDKNTGKSFQELVAEAHGKNNVEDVAWFFYDYKELKAQQRNTCLTELERLVPDLKTINTDPAFFEYLKQQDKRTGKSYHELSAEALGRCNAVDVAWFFNDFKKSKAPNG